MSFEASENLVDDYRQKLNLLLARINKIDPTAVFFGFNPMGTGFNGKALSFAKGAILSLRFSELEQFFRDLPEVPRFS